MTVKEDAGKMFYQVRHQTRMQKFSVFSVDPLVTSGKTLLSMRVHIPITFNNCPESDHSEEEALSLHSL